MIVLYGIDSCDSCRKARRFLAANGLTHRFHDLRKQGVDAASLAQWLQVIGPERLLNRRSTTWRSLDETQRSRAEGTELLKLLIEHPTLIRRPVLDAPNACLAGFDETAYREALLDE